MIASILVAQMPEPFMRRDQGFDVPPAIGRGRQPRQHRLQQMEQLLRDLELSLVAGMMEGYHDFIRQSPCVARRASAGCLLTIVRISLCHRRPLLG
jgi:hypothetical protein